MIPSLEHTREVIFSKVQDSWLHNIPFILVPPEIVSGFKGQVFTYQEFYASEWWKDPNHWNAGYIHNGKMVIFMYGYIHPLEKYLYVERIGSDKEFQSASNKVWELMIQEVERLGREKKLHKVWTVGFRKGEIRKFLSVESAGRLNKNQYVLETIL